MTDKDDVLDESTLIIREIESNLEDVLRKKREEVARDLEEKIRREKEESERRILIIEQQYEKEKEALKEYREAVSEYEAARHSLQTRIRNHLEEASRCQREIEKMTGATLAELKSVNDLTLELASLRQTSEKKIAEIRSKLKEQFGIVTEAPPRQDATELVADLEVELAKLKKIKELLDRESVPSTPPSGPKTEPAEFPEEAEIGPPETLEPGTPQPEFLMPEINQLVESLSGPPASAAVAPEEGHPAGEETRASVDEIDFQAAFESLEKYRKTERMDDVGELSYFQNGSRIVVDGESLVRAIIRVVEKGQALTKKLEAAESPKDQFFIKQELINEQEGLRKIVLRGVRLCEKEGGVFPGYVEQELNRVVIKAILEKLNLDNWSNPENFRAFDEYAGRLADAFYKRITPPARYLSSVLKDLEA